MRTACLASRAVGGSAFRRISSAACRLAWPLAWSLTGFVAADAQTIISAPAVVSSAIDTTGNNLTLTGASGTGYFFGPIKGSGSVAKTDWSTWLLYATNSYTGGTTLDGGILGLGANGALGSGLLTLHYGALQAIGGPRTLANSIQLTGNAEIIGSAPLILSGDVMLTDGLFHELSIGSAGATINGTLAGLESAGYLRKSGEGTLTLNANNTYSGGTVLDGGTIALGSDTALGTGTVTVFAGVLKAQGGARTLANSIRFDGWVNVTGNNPLTLSGDVVLGGWSDIEVSDGAQLTISGQARDDDWGGSRLIKNGPGTLALTHENNLYSQGTDLWDGTLAVGSDHALGTGSLALYGGTIRPINGARTLANLIRLDGWTDYAGTDALTFSGEVTLGFSPEMMISNTAGVTIAGEIKDEGGGGSTISINASSSGEPLRKSGPGTLTLTGDNSYSAGTDLDDGTLRIGSDTALGTGPLTVYYGSLTALGGDRNLAIGLRIEGDTRVTGANQLTFTGKSSFGPWSALDIAEMAHLRIDGNVTDNEWGDAGFLLKWGDGRLTLNGDNSYTGGTEFSNGTLVVGHDHAFGTGQVAIFGGTLEIGGSGPRTLDNAVVLRGWIPITGEAPLTFTGPMALRDWPFLHVINPAGVTIEGPIADTEDQPPARFGKSGHGLLTLHSDNTFAGGFELQEGPVAFQTDGAFGTGQITVGHGTLQVLGGETRTLHNPVRLAGYLNLLGAPLILDGDIKLAGWNQIVVENEGGLTISGSIVTDEGSSDSRLEKHGSGMLTLTGDNSFDGGAGVWKGTLAFSSDTAFGTGAFTFSNGVLLPIGTRTVANPISLEGDVRIAGDAPLTFTSGGLIRWGNIEIANTAGVTFAGPLTNDPWGGSGSFTKSGSGTLLLSGDNTFDGGVNLMEGTLVAASDTAFGSGILTFNGGTLSATDPRVIANDIWCAFDTTIAGAAPITLSGEVMLNGFNRLNITNSAGVTLSGRVREAWSGSTLIKLGSGTLTLTGDNTFTGGAELWEGTLAVGSDTALGNGLLALHGGALEPLGSRTLTNAVQLSGRTAILGSAPLVFAEPFMLAGWGNLDIANPAGVTITRPITEDWEWSSLVKSGSGTLTIASASTYTGGTFIDAGTLRIANTSGSALGSGVVVVSHGGTLTGAGSFTGPLVLEGTLHPGDSPGTMNSGSQIWNGGAAFAWDINHAGGVMGGEVGWSLLAISGTLTLNATAADPFQLRLASFAPDNTLGLLDDFNPYANYSFTFATTTDGISGFDADAFSIITTDFLNPFNGTWSVGLTGDDYSSLSLNYAGGSIPEPAGFAVAAALAALALALHRRRRCHR